MTLGKTLKMEWALEWVSVSVCVCSTLLKEKQQQFYSLTSDLYAKYYMYAHAQLVI